MKKVFAILILLTMTLSLLAGCRTIDLSISFEPLSDEAKALIDQKVHEDRERKVDWDGTGWYEPYYGTINGFAIVQASRGPLTNNSGYTGVAGYGFRAEGYFFELYAYREGKVYTLYEVYKNGWLTKQQIGIIHERHQQIHAAWLKEKEEEAAIEATRPTSPDEKSVQLTVENIQKYVTRGVSWMTMERRFPSGHIISHGEPTNRPICIWQYVGDATDGITLVVQFERPGFDTFVQWLEEIGVPTETTPEGDRYFVGANRYREEWYDGMSATYGALYQKGELMEVLFGELEI